MVGVHAEDVVPFAIAASRYLHVEMPFSPLVSQVEPGDANVPVGCT